MIIDNSEISKVITNIRKVNVEKDSPFINLWPKLGEMELFGLLHKAVKNKSSDILDLHCAVLEELTALSISGLVLTFLTQGWVIHCLEKLSSNDYQFNIIDGVTKGILKGAFCLTEPEFGSDYSNLKTVGRNVDGVWQINGTKKFITNGEFADFFIVAANTAIDEKVNITFFLIPKETHGVITKGLNIHGNNHAGISQIDFNNVGLDSKYILGSVGNGYLMMPRLLNHERMDISLYCQIAMKLGIKSTVEYLCDRKHDEMSLMNYQLIQHSMVNKYQEYQLIKNYITNTAKLLVEGKSCIKEVLISKINSTETGRQILQDLMQLEGANGYLQDVILGTLYSDIAPLSSGGGSNNVLRNALFNNTKIGKGRIVW
ncbi:acyl-CoA dehydrogenase family protein [Pelosinus sp. IPA-1]|uniref:acyl-CoA dehydrogenase family protein n=1 Tax=Pelosinus sp. IPA-1 TaxID=3029569 RepID=UPI0024361AF6|nr:acyl-CoA dehydrogenase family protein [Pelosinus sp. IPA-1]GMA98540.1 isovaleryl-CoA dehydrogenase [Pelosinus sp. IPA-1]